MRESQNQSHFSDDCSVTCIKRISLVQNNWKHIIENTVKINYKLRQHSRLVGKITEGNIQLIFVK